MGLFPKNSSRSLDKSADIIYNRGIQRNNNERKVMNTKELKDQLWEVWYKAREAGASRVATNAILDAMVVIDKEAENSEKTEVCS